MPFLQASAESVKNPRGYEAFAVIKDPKEMNDPGENPAVLPASRRLRVAVVGATVLGLAAMAWFFRHDLFRARALGGPVALAKGGSIPNRGVLGARFEEGTVAPTISEVLAGSAAADAGLMRGDILLTIDSRSVANVAEVGKVMTNTSPGDEVVVRIQRGSETKDVRIKLGGFVDTVLQPRPIQAPPAIRPDSEIAR
jgi:hypothetical protein